MTSTKRRLKEEWEYHVDNLSDDVYESDESSSLSEVSEGEQQHIWKDDWDGEWTEVEEPVETREYDPREGIRDDQGKDLTQMLLEDRLKPSDIMNMKENYERQGKWEYEMSSQKKRIKTLFETEEKQTQMSLRGEVQKGKAVPRTTMICVWKGSDEDENVYWCNNRTIKDHRTDEYLQTCGFHTKRCIGYHSGLHPKIEVPNKHGLCMESYQEQFYGKPPEYKNPFLVPGVVLVKAGMRKHNLAPHHYPSDEQKESIYRPTTERTDESEVSFEAALEPDIIDKAMDGVKKFFSSKAARIRRLHFGATKIQTIYRMLAAKRTAERLRHQRQTKVRQLAARKIQNVFKIRSAMKHYRRMKDDYERSTLKIQKLWRVYRWQSAIESDLKKARAAKLIQNWIRVMWQKENFCIVKARISSQMTALRKDYAKRNMKRVLIGHIARFRHRKYLEELEYKNQMIKKIQKAWVVKSFGKKTHAKIKKREEFIKSVEKDARVTKLQRWLRYRWRYYQGKERRSFILDCATLIQSGIRGFLARKEAKLRRRQIESAWVWLSPKFPRKFYERLLPIRTEMYEKKFGAQIDKFRAGGVRPVPDKDPYDVSTNAGARRYQNEKDRKKAAEMISYLEELFLERDKDQLGMLTHRKFWAVLKEAGIRLTPENATRLAEFFVIPEADKVSWIGYLRFAQGHSQICPLHRLIVCPECLYIGPCPLSGCKEFVGISHSIKGEPVICRCGYHISRHLPALRTHEHIVQVSDDSSSKQQGSATNVAAYAYSELPEMPRQPEPLGKNAPKSAKLPNTTTVVKLSNGRTARLSVTNSEALDTTQASRSLGVAKQQTKVMRAYLKMSNLDSQQPYKDVQDQKTADEQQHEYLFKQKLKRERKQERKEERESWKQRKSQLRCQNQPRKLEDDSVDVIDTTGKIIHTKKVIDEDKSIRFETKNASGLNEEPYKEAIQETLHLSSDHVSKGKHFGHHVSEEMISSHRAAIAKINETARRARLRETALMGYSDTFGSVRGAGKAKKRLPFEVSDGVGPDQQRSFTLSRPIAIVRNDQIKQTTDSTVLYLFILRTLMGPTLDGYDIVADENRLIKFLFDNHSFIEQHWRKIVHDVRSGTLNRHLQLREDQFDALEAEMSPDKDRAIILESIFTGLRYKSRTEFSDKIKRPEYYIKNLEQAVGADTTAQSKAARRKRAIANDEIDNVVLPKIYDDGHADSKYCEDLSAQTKQLLDASRENRSDIPKKDEFAKTRKPHHPKSGPGVPLSKFIDEDGTAYEFGVLDERKRPYVCIHPGCGESFASKRAAGIHVKRHGLSDIQVKTAADYYLAPVWKAAGIGEWPGEEMVPKQREQPLEQQVQHLLSSQIKSNLVTPPPHAILTDTRRESIGNKSVASYARRDSSSSSVRPGSHASRRSFKGPNTVDIFPLAPPPVRALPLEEKSSNNEPLLIILGSLVVRFCGTAEVTPPYLPPPQIQLPACPRHQWLHPKDTCAQCKSFRLLSLPQAPVKFYPVVHFFRYTTPPNWLQKSMSKALELQLYTPSKENRRKSSQKSRSSNLRTAASIDSWFGSEPFEPGEVAESICDGISTIHLADTDINSAIIYSTVTIRRQNDGKPLNFCVFSTCVDKNDDVWLIGWRLYNASHRNNTAGSEVTKEAVSRQSESVQNVRATEQCRVCGRKVLYIKLHSENILSVGIAVQTKKLTTFKHAVRQYRKNQILEMQRIRKTASNKTVERALKPFDLLRSDAIFQQCYFFYGRLSPDKEQAILVAEARLTVTPQTRSSATPKATLTTAPTRGSVRFHDNVSTSHSTRNTVT